MLPAAHTSARLPLLTVDVPGIGGRLRSRDSDFDVEEIPAYEPEGSGDHVFCRIEKTGRTTFDVMRHMAAALGVSDRDVGSAGLKDRNAVTRQWLSFPSPVKPEEVLALALPGVRVLAAARHPHKLRTGHLRGNRFALIVRELNIPAEEAAAIAGRTLEILAGVPGAPNWFGPQRFGSGGTTARTGRALVHGEPMKRKPRGTRRRLAISAYQSLLFNEFLRRRMTDELFHRVLPGDVLKKTDTGGLFVCEDSAVDQTRFERGEIAVTGPMFGHRSSPPAKPGTTPDVGGGDPRTPRSSPPAKPGTTPDVGGGDPRTPRVPSPPEGTEAGLREQAILVAESLTPAAFAPLGKLALGARRPLAVRVRDVAVEPMSADAVRIEFVLPAGTYATAVMREVLKGETDFPE